MKLVYKQQGSKKVLQHLAVVATLALFLVGSIKTDKGSAVKADEDASEARILMKANHRPSGGTKKRMMALGGTYERLPVPSTIDLRNPESLTAIQDDYTTATKKKIHEDVGMEGQPPESSFFHVSGNEGFGGGFKQDKARLNDVREGRDPFDAEKGSLTTRKAEDKHQASSITELMLLEVSKRPIRGGSEGVKKVVDRFIQVDQDALAASEVHPQRQLDTVGYQGLRRAQNIFADQICDLDMLWDPVENKCLDGREFGEDCESNSECFSGHCSTISGHCECPTALDCDGCTSREAACVRVEQTHPSQPMEMCNIDVKRREGKGKGVKMFSSGAAHVESYENLRKLTGKGGCVRTRPFTEEGQLPPAHVQANVYTTDPDEIGEIRLEADDYESMTDGILFLNGEWIKNLVS